MNWLDRRITTLESKQPPGAPCMRCGYPRNCAPDHIVLRHDRPMARCKACGRTLDDEGRPLQGYTKIVRLGPPSVPRKFRRDP